MAGPSHHCAIGVGHIAEELKKVAFLLGIDIEEVK
jgi:L-arabinose isomerase